LSSVLQSFQILHHFFFLLFKLLKEEEVAITDVVKSSAGGFLRQPNFNALPVSEGRNPLSSTPELLKFQYLLAEVAWGIIRKCLVEGKTFIHQSLCQVLFESRRGEPWFYLYCFCFILLSSSVVIFELYLLHMSRVWFIAKVPFI